MNHQTELREVEQLSNGQFAVHVFCCGTYEHRRTIGPEVKDIQASVQEVHQWAAKEHEASVQLQTTLESMKGAKVQHG